MKIVNSIAAIVVSSVLVTPCFAADFICQSTTGCDATFVTQAGKQIALHLDSNATVSTDAGFILNPNNNWQPYR